MSSTENTNPPPPVRRKGWWRRHRVGSLLVTLVLTALLGAVLYVLMGRPIAAPDWLRAEIETRAAEALGDATLRFDTLEVVMEDGAVPTVRMSDVRIMTLTGAEVVAFGELRAGLSLSEVLQGNTRPTSIGITGIFAKLRRQQDGSIVLSGGLDLSSPTQSAASLPELISSMDEMLLRPGFEALAEADVRSLTLRVEDVPSGQAWTVDGGRMRLTREEDALRITTDLALLSGGQGVATLEANYDSVIGDVAATFGATVTDVASGDIAALAPPFAWLDVLRAPISGAMRGGIESDGTFTTLNATLAIAEGVIQPTDATRPVPFDTARAYFSYEPKDRVLTFNELSVDSAWITGQIDGQAVLGVDDTGQLEELVGQFRSSTLTANPDDLYPEPVSFDAAEMDFRMVLNPFRLDVGQALFQDQGQMLLARGMLEATPEGWAFDVDGQMDGLSPERLLALWPQGVITKTRTWLVENLLGGRMSDLDVVVRGRPNAKPSAYVSFAYEDAHVRYAKNLPPVEDARGTASLLDNRFVVMVDQGQVSAPQGGLLDVAGTSFIIPDTTVKDGAPAVVRIAANSTVTAALAMLDQPPLSVMEKAGLSPTLADGQISVDGTLALPLRKGLTPDDLTFNATAIARDVSSTTLIDGRRLASGALRVSASNEGVTVGGQGTLDGVPFDATWEQPIGKGAQASRVAGTIELSERTIDAFRIGLPAGLVSGKGSGDIVVNLPTGGRAPSFTLSSNLRGIRLSSPPLGWSKPASTAATLTLEGALGDQPRIDRLSLDAPGLVANGEITLTAGGGLERARFDRVQVGQWLDAPVDLVGRGANVAPAVEVRGGTLDLRRADFGGAGAGTGGGQGGGPISLSLDTLQITDTIRLTGMRGAFDMARGLDGKFSAKINGGADITGQVLPQNGRSAIRITAADAGAVAASAGLLKQARGGSLSLTLLPVGAAGFDGSLTINETRIKDAPAIAALLNALSIVGLLEQMGGSGIHFQEVEAAFRLTPSTMTLTQASAVGPSMGLSMFGTYDVTQSILNMQGVISPLYLVNGIGSLLTRKGEGLFGFNYDLSGPASNPRVQVNPLSALTPGIFREVFRAPPPTVPEAAPAPSAPAAAPEAPEETNAERLRRERQEASDNR